MCSCAVSFPLVGRCWSHLTIWVQPRLQLHLFPLHSRLVQYRFLRLCVTEPKQASLHQRSLSKRILMYLMQYKEDISLSHLEYPGTSSGKQSSIPPSLTGLSSQQACVLNSKILRKIQITKPAFPLDLGKADLCLRLHASEDLAQCKSMKKINLLKNICVSLSLGPCLLFLV